MLSQLKVKAEANGNSILIRDKKIAGAAQVRRQGLVLYHISFLVRPPAAPIERFLLAMKDGYHTSLVASRPMPIMWLTQVVPQVTANGLISPVTNALSKILGFELEEDSYSEQELERARILQKEKYTSNTWNLSY
jgi:lipoate-protein ligase A